MTIEKLPSGSYRIREMRRGKTYSATLDHKPSQREAREVLDELQRQSPILASRRGMTFLQAYDGFRDAKGAVLSPATLRGYRTSFRALPEWFTQMELARIDRTHVQKVINNHSVSHAPKTTKNLYGLITAVMKFYGAADVPVKLPQPRQGDSYIPSKEDVTKLLKAVSGSKYEAAVRLGMYGLRRSEIMALTLEDLSEDNVLTIDKAQVEGEHGAVTKVTKTEKSTRKLVIDPVLADLIRRQGFVYDGSSSRLSMALTAYEDAAGIPHFPLHKLRHFFASYMHDQGFSDSQIQAAGGWSTDHVMKTVYRHAMNMDEALTDMSRKLSEL